MTVEIKELIIKATVTSQTPSGGAPQASAGAEANTQKIVSLCVAEVLKILKREKER